MNVIQVALFLVFVWGGFFYGMYLVSNVDWFKYFAGCILGGIAGLVLWVMACSLFAFKTKRKKDNEDVFFFLQLRADTLKARSAVELEALPTVSEETVELKKGTVMHLQTVCKKLEDNKFQMTFSATFQEENDTIVCTREFIVPTW